MQNTIDRVATALAVCGLIAGATAQVAIETVTVGNQGNAGQLSGESAGGEGPDRLCGAVDYVYDVAKYEITAGQYTMFLNAVAATDIHELYSPDMWSSQYGCKIERSGTSGSYTYSVAPDRANRPVNYVSWGDSARFANWLHNGQPTGAQGLGTTEDGSYFLDGAMTDLELLGVTRKPDATWAIPSEDEWYKAAFHKDDGVTGNYYDYPTGSDIAPSNDLVEPDPGNNATFEDNEFTIGGPYWRTEAGAHENSVSPHGTFDQGGNVNEWTEEVMLISFRCVRGGSFSSSAPILLHAAYRDNYRSPTHEGHGVGFCIAYLPDLVLGDLNCDEVVDFDDITPFVLALTSEADYQAQYPDCPVNHADCNDDGTVDFDDISPFVAILAG